MSQENPTLYSHHIFIFPFKWDHASQTRVIEFGKKTSLSKLHRLLGESPHSALSKSDLKWERFRFDWKRDYNEAIYFHPYAWGALFDNDPQKVNTVLQYHISGKQRKMQYRIHLQGSSDNIALELEEITLGFYDTGIGILAFHLNNYQSRTPELVLKINDFGRRIYPQFLGYGMDLTAPKGAFLAEKIEIAVDEKVVVSDNFTQILQRLNKSKPEQFPSLIPQYISSVFPKRIISDKSVDIQPLLDDRMHVICWVGDRGWIDEMNGFDHSLRASAQWYSLIFVDGKIQNGIGNQQQALEYNKSHTYQRWIDDSLLYGISRYSFVVLADGANGFHRYVILAHLQTMYFQLVLLCLLQRGSIVRFSEEITRLTQAVTSGVRLKRSSPAVKSLYSKYLEFVNKIYFREVTPQEQGIELYKMIQDKMEIGRDVKTLQSEIQDFFNLIELQATEQQTEAFNTLTIIGSGLLVPSLILAYYGVSAFPDIVNKEDFSYNWTPRIALAGMFAGLLGAWLWIQCRGLKPLIRGLVGMAIIAALLYLFWLVIHVPLLYQIKNN